MQLELTDEEAAAVYITLDRSPLTQSSALVNRVLHKIKEQLPEPRPTVVEQEYLASEWAKCFGDAPRSDGN